MEETIPQTSGVPARSVKPSKWTVERVNEEAKLLMLWLYESEDHVFLASFCKFRKFPVGYLSHWEKNNEAMADALEMARTVQEARLAERLISPTNRNVTGAVFSLKNCCGWFDITKREDKRTEEITNVEVKMNFTPQQQAQCVRTLMDRMEGVLASNANAIPVRAIAAGQSAVELAAK